MESKRVKRRRSAETVAAAAAIAENDDLLMEIIVHLPAKSLLRFKSVSKHWHSLISHPFFTNRHTCLMSRKPTPQPSFMFCSHSRFYFYFNHISKSFCTYNFNSPYTKIVQSSHGLLLLQFKNTKYGLKEYCVYNPTTRQSRLFKVDESKKTRPSSKPMVYLIFNPSRSLHYKVVFLRVVYRPVRKFILRVYNSKLNKFKRKVVAFTSHLPVSLWEGIYWNSRVYWFQPYSKSYYLDFRKSSFRRGPVLIIPSVGSEYIKRNYFLESNGHLYCVCMYIGLKNKYMLVFELLKGLGWNEMSRVDMNPISYLFSVNVLSLEDYMLMFGKDWSSKFKLGVLEIVRAHRDSSISDLSVNRLSLEDFMFDKDFMFAENSNSMFGVLGIVGADRVEDSSILFHVGKKIVLYRFCDNSFEVVLHGSSNSVFTNSKFQFRRNNAYQFIESLAPV